MTDKQVNMKVTRCDYECCPYNRRRSQQFVMKEVCYHPCRDDYRIITKEDKGPDKPFPKWCPLAAYADHAVIVEKLKQAVEILVWVNGSSYCDINKDMRLDIDSLENYVEGLKCQ